VIFAPLGRWDRGSPASTCSNCLLIASSVFGRPDLGMV